MIIVSGTMGVNQALPEPCRDFVLSRIAVQIVEILETVNEKEV